MSPLAATSGAPAAVQPFTRAELAAAVASPAGLAYVSSQRAWTPAPHLLRLASELVRAVALPEHRVTVEMPPRHGKSVLASQTFPAWMLGRWPHRRVLLASYEATFAAEWGMKARDLLEEWGPRLFGVRVDPEANARHAWHTERWDPERSEWVTAGGGMFTAGVGGPMTGRGGDVLLVDDPYKNWEQANSPTYRRKVIEWLLSVGLTRLEPGGSVAIVQTRWHEDDVVGHLTRPPDVNDDDDDPDRDVYERVRMPAIAEPTDDEPDPLGRAAGEALWPDRYDVEALRRIQARVGPRVWAGLYQQRPAPQDGQMFSRSDLRYYRTPSPGSPIFELRADPDDPETWVRYHRRSLKRFAVADLAISEKARSDYTVFGVFGITPEGHLLWLDLIRERMEAADHERMALLVRERHPGLYALGIETVAYQAQLTQRLRRLRLPVKELRPDRDKVTRAMLAETYVAGHRVFLPADAPWVGALEDELVVFPNGAHDDQVDVLAYACHELEHAEGATLRSW